MAKARHYLRYPRALVTSYTPGQLCDLYRFPKLSVSADAVIGIIELGGGYSPADIAAAFASYGLPAPNIVDVSVGGATNSPGTDADGEVVLDIEVAAAAYSYCTGRPARLRVYFAGNDDQSFAAAIRQAAADGCSVCSISWGGPEDSWGASTTAMDAACAAALSAGCTVFAASGDNDSGDGKAGVHVDFPASSPHVVGCGGTSKLASSETVWNSGPNEGTGGGFSTAFSVQSWQIGVPRGNGRMVPDVAACADPNTGYRIFLNGGWQVIGGTSAVAPLYAGLFAAIAAARGGSLGNVLPTLYQRQTAFVDISVGNNGSWRAMVGPDPCTGLGVPIGEALSLALGGTVAPPPPPPVLPPPPVTVPPVVPPPTAKGKIIIDLDTKTATFPHGGWKVGVA